MRREIITVLLAGTLMGVPGAGFAAAQGKAKATPAATHASTSTAATHATRGVVKSVDGTALTITRTGKQGGEMTFSVSPSTHREGTVAVGAPVSVRYREDGKTLVATAITVQQVKQQAAHAAASRR